MAQKKYIKNNTNKPIIIGDLNLEIPPKAIREIFSIKLIQKIALSLDIENLINANKIAVYDDTNNILNTENAKQSLKIASKDDEGQTVIVNVDGSTSYTTVEDDQYVIVTTAAELSTALSAATNTTIQMEKGNYTFNAPLNITNKTNVKIIGAGKSTTTITFSGDGSGTADKPMVDMSGSTYCGLSELTIVYNVGASNNASCGLLIGRPNSNAFSGGHEFHNLNIEGYFKIAALVNVGSDKNRWYSCKFQNYGTANASTTLYLCTTAPGSLGALQAIGTGAIQGENFLHCELTRNQANIFGNDTCMYIEGGTVQDIVWKGAGTSMSFAPTPYSYTFDNATSNNPGSGEIRFNNATLASADTIYIHDTDAGATDRDAILDALIAGGNIRIYRSGATSNYLEATITSVTDSGTYHTIGINNIVTAGSFSDGQTLIVSLTQQKSTIQIHALATNNIKNLCFHHFRPEGNGCKSIFHITAADSGGVVSGLNVSGNSFIYGERVIYADDNVTLTNARIWAPNSGPTQPSSWGYGNDGITWAANGTRATFDVAKCTNCEIDLLGMQYDQGDGAGNPQNTHLPVFLYRVRSDSTTSRYISLTPARTAGASPFPNSLVTGDPAAGQIILRS